MSEFLNPVEVLNKLELKKDMVAADFGCGSGGWAIPLAKILEKGKVFAIDVLEEPLSALRGKIKLERVLNIETKKTDVEKTSLLLSECCDLVLMTNLLFQIDDVKKVLEEAKRILKRGGQILVVEWKEGLSFGPEKKVDKNQIIEIARKIGLAVEKEIEAGFSHWAIVFKKQ